MACEQSEKFSKLPELARPLIYSIWLEPDLSTFKYEGNEEIKLEITQPTDKFVLYSSYLEIGSVSVVLADGTEHQISKDNVEMDAKRMFMTIRLPSVVEPQQASLKVAFSGELRDKMTGFYRSSYSAADGSTKYMASTQFESTYARQAFPCWDEPTYKAQFNITLEVDEKFTALSNMNVIEETNTGSGTKVVKFDRTPVMSTYLVGFAVGDFEFIQTKTKSGMDVRVYTVPGKSAMCQFALDIASKSLDWYSEWFGVKMLLPKCDLVAVPDFNFGAMENWGLVTFREIRLVMNPNKTSTLFKEACALTTAHEIAHFWFGNLVTMKWWCDLWLKEGFASFMEYLFTARNYPEFNIWLSFLRDEVDSAWSLDSMRNSHPIEVPIGNPNELEEIYDSITYAKSNSILRMLFDYLGEETFRRGLNSYLTTFQYSNAVTVDLWKCLSEASGQDIDAMMSTWTKQMGYPLVTITNSKRLDGNRLEMTLRQTRYIADGGPDSLGSIWQIPIGITRASDPTGPFKKIFFTKPEETFVIDGVKPDEWIKLNSRTSGFFRVNYSEEMFHTLLAAFNKGKNVAPTMDVLDRFGFVNDLFALVSSGHLPVTRFLELVNEAGSEDEYLIWNVIDSGLGQLTNILRYIDDGGKLAARFNNFIIQLLAPIAERLTWTPAEGEKSSVGLWRALIISRLCKAGHEPTKQMAHAKFREYFDNKVEIVPDLRSVVFTTVARSNCPTALQQLRQIYESVNFSEVECQCVTALSQVTDSVLLEAQLRWGMLEDGVRNQDSFRLFLGGMGSRVGCESTWNFFKNNMRTILKKYDSPNSLIFQRIFKFSVSSHCTDGMATEVENFHRENFDSDEQKCLERTVAQTVEGIRLNAKLLKENAEQMEKFLTKAGF